MAGSVEPAGSYEELKVRLDQIVEAVSANDLPLDDALDLYEEAVKLGMRASELIEQDARLDQSKEPEHEPADS